MLVFRERGALRMLVVRILSRMDALSAGHPHMLSGCATSALRALWFVLRDTNWLALGILDWVVDWWWLECWTGGGWVIDLEAHAGKNAPWGARTPDLEVNSLTL
jgi:hypothetical protein